MHKVLFGCQHTELGSGYGLGISFHAKLCSFSHILTILSFGLERLRTLDFSHVCLDTKWLIVCIMACLLAKRFDKTNQGFGSTFSASLARELG